MMCVDIMRPPEIAADRTEHGKLPPQHIPVVFYSVWVSHEKWSIWSNLPHLWKISVLQVNVTLSYSLLWHPECWRGTWGWVPAQPGPSSPCVNSRLTAPSLWEVCFACWPDANAQLKGSVPDFIRGLGDMCQVPAAHTSYQPSIQSQLKDPLWHHTDPSGLGWMPGSLLATNLPSCGLEASPLLPDVTCLKGLHLNHLQATRASEHNLSSNNINQGSVIWGEWDLASHPVRCRRAGKYDSEEGVGYLLSCKVREQAKKCMARTPRKCRLGFRLPSPPLGLKVRVECTCQDLLGLNSEEVLRSHYCQWIQDKGPGARQLPPTAEGPRQPRDSELASASQQSS